MAVNRPVNRIGLVFHRGQHSHHPGTKVTVSNVYCGIVGMIDKQPHQFPHFLNVLVDHAHSLTLPSASMIGFGSTRLSFNTLPELSKTTPGFFSLRRRTRKARYSSVVICNRLGCSFGIVFPPDVLNCHRVHFCDVFQILLQFCQRTRPTLSNHVARFSGRQESPAVSIQVVCRDLAGTNHVAE
jgi:hypothetical protein